MPLERTQHFPVMCLTQDGLPISHVEQALRLCVAGAGWIQLRMKNARRDTWLGTAMDIVTICRAHNAVCIINDSVDIALAAEADGVHLGAGDEDWAEARRRLGRRRIVGGTVNNASQADLAARADCLDYVGIGPWRFTTSKRNLAPVLGPSGVRDLVAQLDGLPAWAIGGITLADLPAVRATGAVGVAVSSALYGAGHLEENFRSLLTTWRSPTSELKS